MQGLLIVFLFGLLLFVLASFFSNGTRNYTKMP
jgi:hypothetical protein